MELNTQEFKEEVYFTPNEFSLPFIYQSGLDTDWEQLAFKLGLNDRL